MYQKESKYMNQKDEEMTDAIIERYSVLLDLLATDD